MTKKWLIGIVALFVLLISIGFVYKVTADAPVEGRAGRAEVRFLEGMIDHHQMALDMAQDCLKKATSESVVTLCNNIITVQTGEIHTMQGWLQNWYGIVYAPVPMTSMEMESASTGGHDGHANATVTDPPMTMGMMAGLARLEGAEYETAWLEAMIDHHDDALHMADRILQRGEHQELLDLAQRIIDDQTAEIAQMETMLTN